MELWIRSQDKNTLIRVNRISFERNIDDEPTIYGYENYDNYERLGIYKTKERALEVLDEIQNLLNPMLVFKNCNCTQEMLDNIKEAGTCVVSDNAHIEKIQTCIYEMPEE